MAQSITKIRSNTPTPQQVSLEKLNIVTTALENHSDGVAQFIKLVGLLHERGILNMLTAALEQGEDILKIVVDQAGKPGYAQGLKNMLGLTQMLGKLDVTALNDMMSALANAKEAAAKGEATQVNGIWDLLKMFRDPETTAGLSFMLTLLKALGAGMQPKPSSDASNVEDVVV